MSKLSRSLDWIPLLILLSLGSWTLACSTPEEQAEEADSSRQPEAVSLLGQPLHAREDTQKQIERADAVRSTNPEDLNLLLNAAAARASVWHYRDAINLYTQAIEMAPDDWRPYRFRGHRYISTRQFDKAVTDLEKARELSPHSFDVSYHLGLAYYLQGRFDEAADEYGRCMALAEDAEALELEESGELGEDFRSCMAIADAPSTRVAMAAWRNRALRRADRHEESQALLETIEPGWILDSNHAYYLDLLLNKGLITEEELLSPEHRNENRFETLGYAITAWNLAEGNDARAMEILDLIVQDEHWPGFGRIAAEADLARMGSEVKEDSP